MEPSPTLCTFADAKGREYTVRIVVNMLPELHGKGLKVFPIADAVTKLNELAQDNPEAYARLLHVVARGPQPAAFADFAEGLDGPTLVRSLDAFVHGLIDFFPESTVAKSLRSMWAKAIAERETST